MIVFLGIALAAMIGYAAGSWNCGRIKDREWTVFHDAKIHDMATTTSKIIADLDAKHRRRISGFREAVRTIEERFSITLGINDGDVS